MFVMGVISPDNLWNTFRVILPFPSRIVYFHNWIALWISPVESKKSNSFPSFHPALSVPLPQTGSVFAGRILFLFLVSPEMTDKSMSYTPDVFRQMVVHPRL